MRFSRSINSVLIYRVRIIFEVTNECEVWYNLFQN